MKIKAKKKIIIPLLFCVAGISAIHPMGVFAKESEAKIPVSQSFVSAAVPNGEVRYRLRSENGKMPDDTYGGEYTFSLKNNENTFINIPTDSVAGDYEYELECVYVTDAGYRIQDAKYSITVHVSSNGVVSPEIKNHDGNKVEEAAFLGVTFDPNKGVYADGSDELFTIMTVMDESITVIDAPTRTGYDFDYWKGSKFYPGDVYNVEEPHLFVAQWIARSNDDNNPGDTNPGDGNPGGDTSSNGDTSGRRTGQASSSRVSRASNADTGDRSGINVFIITAGVSGAALLIIIIIVARRKKDYD